MNLFYKPCRNMYWFNSLCFFFFLFFFLWGHVLPVTQAALKLVAILLSHSPNCWYCRYATTLGFILVYCGYIIINLSCLCLCLWIIFTMMTKQDLVWRNIDVFCVDTYKKIALSVGTCTWWNCINRPDRQDAEDGALSYSWISGTVSAENGELRMAGLGEVGVHCYFNPL